MALHADPDNLYLSSGTDYENPSQAIDLTFPHYLTDPAGNYLTDPAGNRLVVNIAETIFTRWVYANPDSTLLSASADTTTMTAEADDMLLSAEAL